MIPKIIHYVWVGDKEIPQDQQKYIEGWKKLMPDYEFKLWNEKNFDFSDCTYAVEAYENKKYSFVADYIRVKVLNQYGGIYLDTDVEVIKPLDELLNYDFFTCFENAAYVQTGTFGSIPNHPILLSLIKYYMQKNFVENGKIDSMPNPLLFTYVLKTDFDMSLNAKMQSLACLGGGGN